jgi:hypothetical protein
MNNVLLSTHFRFADDAEVIGSEPHTRCRELLSKQADVPGGSNVLGVWLGESAPWGPSMGTC